MFSCWTVCANKVVYKTKSIAYLRAINKTLLFYIFISVWGGVAVYVCVLCIQRKPIWKFNSESNSNSVSIRLHVVWSSFVHWLFNRWHVDTIASMQLYTQLCMCVCVCRFICSTFEELSSSLVARLTNVLQNREIYKTCVCTHVSS